jgi:hypothetical protein
MILTKDVLLLLVGLSLVSPSLLLTSTNDLEE